MRRGAVERVVFDSSVLLGRQRLHAVGAARLGYVRGCWSAWILAEFVRVRTELIAERAARDGCDLAETRLRLRASRGRVNALIARFTQAFELVDYRGAPEANLSWLSDPDDLPVMRTALAVGADTLVTDNSRDFPSGEIRNGILFLSTADFLAELYRKFPDAEAAIDAYVEADS